MKSFQDVRVLLSLFVVLAVVVPCCADFEVVKVGDSLVDEEALTIKGNFGQAINGVSFQQEVMVTHQDYQYAAYYDGERRVCIARRQFLKAIGKSFNFKTIVSRVTTRIIQSRWESARTTGRFILRSIITDTRFTIVLLARASLQIRKTSLGKLRFSGRLNRRSSGAGRFVLRIRGFGKPPMAVCNSAIGKAGRETAIGCWSTTMIIPERGPVRGKSTRGLGTFRMEWVRAAPGVPIPMGTVMGPMEISIRHGFGERVVRVPITI